MKWEQKGASWGSYSHEFTEAMFKKIMQSIYQGPAGSTDDLDAILHPDFVNKFDESVVDIDKFKAYITGVRSVMSLQEFEVHFFVCKDNMCAARFYIRLKGPAMEEAPLRQHFEVFTTMTLAPDGRLLSLFGSSRECAENEKHISEPRV